MLSKISSSAFDAPVDGRSLFRHMLVEAFD